MLGVRLKIEDKITRFSGLQEIEYSAVADKKVYF